jgi:hypothetical protein
MPTYTTNYSFNKPLVNNATDADLWGGQLNTNFDSLDTLLFAGLSKFTTEGTIASATTTDLGTVTTSNIISITGTTTITGLGSSASTANPLYFVRFTGILTLTHNGTSLILPAGINITTAAGDAAILKYEGSGNWRCINYARASGAPILAANKFFARASTGDSAAKDITDFALTLLDDANAATARTTLGVGTGLVYSGATAFSGAQPTSYTDLNLSSIVGTNRAWVTLKITGDANSNIFFRTKGETLDAYAGLGSAASFGSGTSGTSMNNSVAYLSLLTDTSGIVQWRSNIASTTTVVTVLTYMVTS